MTAAGSLPRFAQLRQVYDLSLAGAIGAVFGLFLFVELVDRELTVYMRDAMAGLAIGGTVGFFLNASGPFRDGAWLKLARASTWGAIAGAAGGALGLVLGEMVIGLFRGGLVGRSLSWAVLGLGIGVSQGLADRSRQRLFYGLIGGALGGAIGGYFFEMLRVVLGERHDLGQGLGIAILGAGLGLFLALVEQVLRRSWVQVLSGRQEGRSYLLSKQRSAIGLNERAEVGLFADPLIARQHAEIERTARGYVLHNVNASNRTIVNGSGVTGDVLLKDGDRIELGRTLLVFRQR